MISFSESGNSVPIWLDWVGFSSGPQPSSFPAFLCLVYVHSNNFFCPLPTSFHCTLVIYIISLISTWHDFLVFGSRYTEFRSQLCYVILGRHDLSVPQLLYLKNVRSNSSQPLSKHFRLCCTLELPRVFLFCFFLSWCLLPPQILWLVWVWPRHWNF